MKIDISREWSLRMAQLEGDCEIGAGACAFDPVVEGQTAEAPAAADEPSIAFGRFVRLMRRREGLSVEKLAQEADLDVSELVEIEDDVRHKPEPRTVYQLANFFKVPRGNLMQIAGLTAARNDNLVEEAVRFAARSESVAQLTPQERAALEEFVSVLSKQ